MMKYGNIHIKLPDFKKEYAALDDLYEKELITEHDYIKRKQDLKTASLKFIVATNGGYSPRKHGRRQLRDKLSAQREKVTAERSTQFMSQNPVEVPELPTEE